MRFWAARSKILFENLIFRIEFIFSNIIIFEILEFYSKIKFYSKNTFSTSRKINSIRKILFENTKIIFEKTSVTKMFLKIIFEKNKDYIRKNNKNNPDSFPITSCQNNRLENKLFWIFIIFLIYLLIDLIVAPLVIFVKQCVSNSLVSKPIQMKNWNHSGDAVNGFQ